MITEISETGWRKAIRLARWFSLALVLARPDAPEAEQADGAPRVRRIVSLGPSLTKQLYLLGVAEKVVGVTTYCPRPPNLPPIEKIGSVVDPNVERIIRLKPDLVLATPLTNRRRVATLQKLGIPIVEFRSAESFDELCNQFLQLGKRVGAEREAGEIVGSAREKVAALSKTVAGLDRPDVFIQIGARPLCTTGKGTFLHDLIETAGGRNIAEETKVVTYSREAVLAANPECILVVTMGLTGPDEMRKWSRYENLAAAENERIHMIDSDRVCSPTPKSFVEALERIIGLLHPAARTARGDEP